ncbi:hypothetical protein GSI_15391 [Ganoderma sinense ZZ0214-1]|uniref:Uncharacterized protein n=1 Tax=Ganoderma sinense ZZ0214-1 TaxID=1077348 RepID=A0A2G8RN06_9APHY|nr:hypothetical protein GSI_15391 [Ganoderma sinense ZZ0214-1]
MSGGDRSRQHSRVGGGRLRQGGHRPGSWRIARRGGNGASVDLADAGEVAEFERGAVEGAEGSKEWGVKEVDKEGGGSGVWVAPAGREDRRGVKGVPGGNGGAAGSSEEERAGIDGAVSPPGRHS